MLTEEQKAKIISPENQKRIREAVAAAEARTSGEIMPVITRRSSVYRAAEYRGSLVAAILAYLLVVWLWAPARLWAGDITLLDILIPGITSLVSGIIGYYLVNIIPSLERFFTGTKEINEAIANSVFREFMLNNLSATRDRTGVIIYISLFEKRVQILADSGINSQVSPDAWKEVVDEIVDGIKSGDMTSALCNGIGRIGDILTGKFPVKKDDTNELGDLVIT